MKSVCFFMAICYAGTYCAAQTAPQERYALLVGVDYRNNPNGGLLFRDGAPARDVDLVKRTLGNHFQVRVLSEVQGSFAQPTTANIESQLDGLRDWVTPGALVLIMVSGHGFMYHDTSYLLGSDANTSDITMLRRGAVSIEFVKSRINRTQASQAIILWDACRDFGAPAGNLSATDEVAGDEKHVPLTSDHLLIYSTAPTSQSRTDPEKHVGYFTEALVQGLTSPGQTWETLAGGLTLGDQQKPQVELTDGAKGNVLSTTQSTPASSPPPLTCSAFDTIEDPCRCDAALTDPLKAPGTERIQCQTIGPNNQGVISAKSDPPFHLEVSTADLSQKQNEWFLRSDDDGTQTDPMQLPNGFEIAATGTGTWHVDRVLYDQNTSLLTVTASCVGVRKFNGHRSPCSITYEIIEHHLTPQ